MQTHTILLTVSVLIEVSAFSEEQREESLIAQSSAIETAIDDALGPIPPHLGWVSTQLTELDPLTMNCGCCAKCGVWVTDRERPNAISGLQNGARVNGLLLCDDDLPKEHRWAF